MWRTSLLAAVVLTTAVPAAGAAVQTKVITYDHDGTNLKGFLAWDDSAQGKRPGVLVFHEWWGLNDYARDRAKQLAGLGYVAFCPDMYGDGKVTTHPAEAGKMATEARANAKTWLGRAQAGLKVLLNQETVDPKRVAAIGYCFGGSTALLLAFSGADLAAAVSFHGALPVPTAEQARNTKARILICHGALDSFIPEETIQKVRAALEAGKVDYEMIYYGGAVHSFTVPDADKAGVKGLSYNAAADRRSWQAMRDLFHEVFGGNK
jgi:dienelactone hydrolase